MIKIDYLKEYTSMNWTKDALFTKAKLYAEKAFTEEKDSPFFGIFMTFSFELLSRAAIANIHPVLLAEQDAKQGNILYALGINCSTKSPKSIPISKVIDLCKDQIKDFSDEMSKWALLLIDRRNEELHSGGAAFSDFNQDKWIVELYRMCKVLTESMGESMETYLGTDRCEEAMSIISDYDSKIMKQVKDKIAFRKKTFEEDYQNQKNDIDKKILKVHFDITAKTHMGFHKVTCPCCGNEATIHGKESSFSREKIEDDYVTIKRDVIPNSFQCDICGLKLSSYGELKVAGLPLHYTNTYTYDPIDYFGIDIHSEDGTDYYEEYSNE